MKMLTQEEATRVTGGEPLTAGAAIVLALFGAAAYIGKDIYQHWSEFKEAVADGWNNS
ncbi:MAG: hypothetical protein KBA71_09040 [Opitutaceae bacterium]|nr:hypothetical protein [Opitutaceae bacterium]